MHTWMSCLDISSGEITGDGVDMKHPGMMSETLIVSVDSAYLNIVDVRVDVDHVVADTTVFAVPDMTVNENREAADTNVEVPVNVDRAISGMNVEVHVNADMDRGEDHFPVDVVVVVVVVVELVNVMFVDMGAIYVHANMAYVDVSVDRTNVICGDHVDVIYANVDHVDVIYVDHTDVIDIVYQ